MKRNGFTPQRRPAENGFTLVELVVALFIFGMLAASGVALLSFSVRAQAAAGQRLDAVGNDARMSALLASDLAQAVPRVTRDTTGAQAKAFTGTNGIGAAPLLRYVRGGWTNPDGLSRASVQRVEIALVGDRLERRTYPMADGAVADPPSILASNVEAVGMRYRDRGMWSESWDTAEPRKLPSAVEMVLKRKGQPGLLMAFLVGTPGL